MQVTVIHRNFFAGLAIALVCHATLFAGSPASLLINQFTGVDSVLAGFTHSVRPGKCDSSALAQALEDLLRQNSGLAAVALADSRGNVIGFSGYEAGNEALSRKVSGREWYRAPRKTLKPYYGPLTEVDRRFCSLWSRPLLAQSALGITACEGVLVAYINVAECLRNFSRVYRRPFEIGRDAAVFYHTDDWQNGLPFEEERFSLQGGLEFTLRYTDMPLPDPAAADSLVAASGSASTASVQPVSSSLEPRSQTKAPPGGSQETTRSSHQSMAWIYFLIAGILGLGFGSAYVIRLERKKGRLREEEYARARIIEEENDVERKNVKSDMYQEIRSRIGKSEVLKIEQEIKTGLRREMEKAIVAKDGESLRRELELEMRKKASTEMLEEIRRQLLTTENAALREEARGKLLEELSQRLRKEVGGQLEMEALQALTRTMHGEVRAEYAKSLRERALKDLDERTRQEVFIRERAMLLTNARASIKETIEKEIREKEGNELRKEVREAVVAAIRRELEDAASCKDLASGPDETLLPEGESARETVRKVLADVRGTIRKIDESESLLSLAKTVDLLKSSQRDSPYFNLNAAQTSSMIEYLENVSGRMQGYVADVKSGLGRLYRNIDRLLREKQCGGPGEVASIGKEQPGTDAIKTEETETIAASE